jgi:hypothetical protein
MIPLVGAIGAMVIPVLGPWGICGSFVPDVVKVTAGEPPRFAALVRIWPPRGAVIFTWRRRSYMSWQADIETSILKAAEVRILENFSREKRVQAICRFGGLILER